MKIQEPRRHRSIATNLLFLLAFVVWAGCDSATPSANAPSVDEAPSQSPLASDEQTSGKNKEITAQDDKTGSQGDDTGSQENASGVATNAAENTADSTTPANPPAAAQSPAMSAEAFLMAAGEGRTEDVKRGLDSGMNIESAEPGREHTALHHAAYNGHTATVLFLIKQGATLDCRDHEGKTPLIHACTGPFPETVQALIKAGADVNAKGTAEGFTPLMMAAGLDQLKTVQILLDNGANKGAVDEDNDKAIDHARRAGLTEIVKVLQ